MSVKGLVDSAVEMANTHTGVNGAKSVPKQKQSKLRGVLMVATAIMLISSGLKMLKNRHAH